MLAQRLRHAVRIEAPGNVINAYGEQVPGWTTFADNVRASVEPVSARERMAAGANAPAQDARIVMRYRAGVTEQMRIVYNGTYYAINGVIDVGEQRRMLELDCTKGVAQS